MIESHIQLPEFLTVDEAAVLLRVHPSAIYDAIRRGMPARKVGKSYRIHRDELRAWFGGSAHTPALAEALAPAVAAQVLAALGDAFASLGKRLDLDRKYERGQR